MFAPMKEKLKKIWENARGWLHGIATWKIVVSIFIATVLLITFVGDFKLIKRFEKMSKLHELHESEEYYEKKIEDNKARLEELMSGKEELEKFAREQYYMKEEDEEIFLVILE